jgi:hypothetical protein
MLATHSEAARILGLSRQAIYKKTAAGKLDTVQQDGKTFVQLPDPEPDANLSVDAILRSIPELPGAKAAQADAEAVLAGMLDRLAELRRLLNPGRSNADNARVVNGGGFDGLAGEIDQLTISLATQRSKVVRCRLRVAELIRDAVTPAVAPQRARYESARATMLETGARLAELQSTADSARRDASDLAYQLKAQSLA